MNVTDIYKDTKIYELSKPFGGMDKAPMSMPAVFSGVSILYEYEPAPSLPDDLNVFLGKVIEGGMKLDPANILTANFCYTDVSLQKLAEQVRSKIVIIFGLKWLNELKNANIRKNEVVKLYGMKVLITDTLDVINTNDAAKKAFWVELKKIL